MRVRVAKKMAAKWCAEQLQKAVNREIDGFEELSDRNFIRVQQSIMYYISYLRMKAGLEYEKIEFGLDVYNEEDE